MRYKANDITEDGLDLDLPITGKWLGEMCPELDASLGPDGLRLAGRIERSGEDLLLRGSLKGSLMMTCSRCVEPTAVPVDVPIFVSFVERDPRQGAEGGEVDLEDESADFVVFDDGVLDLGEEVREELLLALPMSPLCSSDCPGLCPICGKNRAKSPCDCVEKARLASTPFAVLASKMKS